MNNRKVIMIGNHLPVTKWNKNVWHYLAEKLGSAGWTVITTSNKENQYLRLLDMLISIWHHRKEYSIAQVDVFSGKAFIYTQLCTALLYILKKPMVLTLHGGGLDEFCYRYQRRCRRVLQRANQVVTPSQALQKHLSEYRNDIRYIPNPIDLSRSLYRVRKKAKPVLIWVRAFHEIYNPSLSIMSVKRLINDYPEIKLIMIGPDKGDGTLGRQKKLIQKLNLEDHVTIIGGTPHFEIPGWLDTADIFINSTNYDAAPRSVLEAMANGLCVVSTNVGGIPYLINNGVEGLLVEPNDEIEMTAAIRSILSNPQIAENLSLNARQKAAEYDWNSILPQWEATLMEVLNHDQGS